MHGFWLRFAGVKGTLTDSAKHVRQGDKWYERLEHSLEKDRQLYTYSY